jgi:hypothetical protein
MLIIVTNFIAILVKIDIILVQLKFDFNYLIISRFGSLIMSFLLVELTSFFLIYHLDPCLKSSFQVPVLKIFQFTIAVSVH